MLGFISILILLLIGAGVWSVQIKANSEGNKFLQMFPYWVIAYGVSLALLCPVAFFSIWEHNIDFILTCVVLSIALVFALLIIGAFVVAIIKKQYRNAGRIVGIGVLLIIYTFIVSLFAGMGKGHLTISGSVILFQKEWNMKKLMLQKGGILVTVLSKNGIV